MTNTEDIAKVLDGRQARRQRNIDAVLDVVLEMFAEEAMFPTIEQAATRSGLSLRSLYRYFADPGELLEAVIKRSDEIGAEFSKLHSIGKGSLADRVEAFISMRLTLHEATAPIFRATLVNAARHPRIREELTRQRNAMRQQFERLQLGEQVAGGGGPFGPDGGSAGTSRLIQPCTPAGCLQTDEQLSVVLASEQHSEAFRE